LAGQLCVEPSPACTEHHANAHESFSQRKDGEGYKGAVIDEHLKACYANPLGEIPASDGAAATAAASAAAPAKEGSMEGRLTLLENLIKASRSIAMELDPLKATKNIIDEACSILHADRATIFKVRSCVALHVRYLTLAHLSSACLGDGPRI
jgi:hypothetical protein